MNFNQAFKALFFIGSILAASSASATNISVDAHSGPWDPTIAGNFDYGRIPHDHTGPASLAVNAGDTITINYVSGLTSAFDGVVPTVGPIGYDYLGFGSGTGRDGIGSSGKFFPSAFIDPTNTGSPIYLAALIGDFVDINGVVLSAFATGLSYTVVAPTNAVAIQFGLNDDIFFDNSGALLISVDGSSAAPVPGPMVGAGRLVMAFGGILAWHRRRAALAA
jgi:hypothetical protein